MTEELFTDSPVHLVLIDPDEQSAGEAGEMARSAERGGTDAVMIGGSIGSVGNLVQDTVSEVKEATDLPVVLFPADHGSIAPNADAVFFMSMLNSRNPMYITGFQMMGAPIVKQHGIKTLSMAYLPVEPAGKSAVGYVSDARPIPRKKTDVAVAYSLAAQYMGMEYIYLEGGSGVDEPVPLEMVGAVKEMTDLTVIVGGGINTPVRAGKRVAAGADVIVTGTAVEGTEDIEITIGGFVKAIEAASEE